MNPSYVGDLGMVVDSPRSPLAMQEVTLFHGFNPAMVSSCLRDTLRFLFSTAAPNRLKYSSNPKESMVAIDLSFDVHQEEGEQKRPKIIINRGPYQSSSIGLTDSATSGGLVTGTGSGITNRTEYMNLVQGTCSIRIVAWQLGVCEELAFLVATFLTWSRPHICNTLGFKNIASPVSSSPVMLDKDDKDKFIVEVTIPYSTEMKWSDTEIGVKLKGFLIELVNEDNS